MRAGRASAWAHLSTGAPHLPPPEDAKRPSLSAGGAGSREPHLADWNEGTARRCGLWSWYRFPREQTFLEFTTPVIFPLIEGTLMSRSSPFVSAPYAAQEVPTPRTRANTLGTNFVLNRDDKGVWGTKVWCSIWNKTAWI